MALLTPSVAKSKRKRGFIEIRSKEGQRRIGKENNETSGSMSRTPGGDRVLLAGPVTMERGPCWSGFSGRSCDPVGGSGQSRLFLKDCTPWQPTLGQLMKNCSPWEGLTLEKFMENCVPRQDPMLEQESTVRSPFPEEEGAAETVCDELTASPLVSHWWEGERENQEKKVKPRKKGGVRRKCF